MTVEYITIYHDYNTNPLTVDCSTNLSDLILLAGYWLEDDCGTNNNWCNGSDLTQTGTVMLNDLSQFASYWLLFEDYKYTYIDNFNDNDMGPMWTLMASNETKCWLDETNQRLELRASDVAQHGFVLYSPNGWHLDTSRDFGFQMRYHYELESDRGSVLLFALGSTPDPVNNYLEFSICVDTDEMYSGAFYFQFTQNGFQIDELYIPRYSINGWIFVSYDSTLDELYFGLEGYGLTNSMKTVSNLFKGSWAGTNISPYVGGSSDQFEILSGQAYWDDLILDYGNIIYE